MNISFTPPATCAAFMASGAFIRFLMGPVGSGKTTTCIFELLRRAAQQKPDSDGIRYTRFAIVRNTLQQLKTTVLKDVEQLLRPIVDYRVSESTIYIRKGDIHTEWLLIPLETQEDQKRLLSTQLTGAWINEFGEATPELVGAIAGRCGRYPRKNLLTWHGVIGDSNFPSEDSPWYELFELKRPSNWDVFKQPGGLDHDAENVENLPPRYYENLIEGHSEDWVERYVHARYGRSLSGQAVFRASFDPDYHVSDSELRPTPGYPLIIAQDFGRTPAALITQVNHRGSLLVLHELTSEDMGLRQFLRQELNTALSMPRFAGWPVAVVADPAGRAKSQLSEETAFDVLKDEGYRALAAPSNELDRRLRAVEKLFLERRGDQPALIIDRHNCPLLLRALKHEYRYKRKKAGDLEDIPEKNHPWSDLADCLQYAAMGANAGLLGKIMRPRLDLRPAPSAAAWT
jgi:hypothetical protein